MHTIRRDAAPVGAPPSDSARRAARTASAVSSVTGAGAAAAVGALGNAASALIHSCTSPGDRSPHGAGVSAPASARASMA